MANSFVQVAPDSTGKKVQTFQNTIAGDAVQAEAVALVTSAGTEVGTSSAPLRVDPTGVTVQPVSGTVTANAGTNLNTSALALDASVTGLQVAQSSTTSGQKGELIQGAVVASSASSIYSTGNTDPLCILTTGDLRVAVRGNTGVVLDSTPGILDGNIKNIGGATVATAAAGSLLVGVTGFNGSRIDGIGQNGTAPANEIIVGGQFNTTPSTISSTKVSPLQLDSVGSLRTVLEDAAGNIRGANVDASNRLSIDNTSWLGSTAPTVGSKTSANSVPVVIASDQGAVAISGTITANASGTLTNNNAAPGANNMGVLPALANAANPSWTEGDQVLESVDLAGNQRVKVNAALPAGSNVIGHVIADSGSTTAVTGNVTVVQATGTNLHAVLDTTSTTAVTQATGTNLHAVIDSGTITTVSTVTAVTAITNALPAGSNVIGHVITDSGSVTAATLSAETTKVIGTVRVQGNVGGVMDAAGQNAVAPANELLIAGTYQATPPSLTDTHANPLLLDSAGNLCINVKAGSSGNAAASATGSAVPASADYQGVNVGGTLRGVTGVNPSGSVFAEQIDITSVGGTTVVTAGVAGIIAVGGNVANAVTATANPIPVGGVFTTTPATLTSGQTATLQFSAAQNVLTDATTYGGVAVVTGGVNGSTGVGGLAAKGATTAGNPVLIAGSTYAGTPKVGQICVNSSGGLAVTDFLSGADGLGNAQLAQMVIDGGSGSGNLAIDSFIFNGTTWDRQRANLNTTTGDSGTKTATFTGATQTNYNARGAIITVLLGTVSGTTPTLAIQLQWSPDAGTTWLNLGTVVGNLTTTNDTGAIIIYPGASVTTTTGAVQTSAINAPLPRTWRLNYTIGAVANPSFAITSVQVNYIL